MQQIVDVVIIGLIVFSQYQTNKKIHKLDVDNDFALSAIEQLETRVIQNEKKK